MAQTFTLLLLFVTYCSSETFKDPEFAYSVNGNLSLTFDVAINNVKLGDYTVPCITYNGSYIPPVISLAPGETLNLLLINHIGELNMTNIHFHGMDVTPEAPADNIFLEIDFNTAYQYIVRVPTYQYRGLYWFHSHTMDSSEYQVFNGLSGGIDVQGVLNTFPQEIQSVTQHVMLLKDTPIINGTITTDVDITQVDAIITTVNGQVNPTLYITPGELQFWRFGAIAADRYFELIFTPINGTPSTEWNFHIAAQDGILLNQLIPNASIFLPPGKRLEVFVKGPPAGSYLIQGSRFNTGPEGDTYILADLLTVVSTGATVNDFDLPASGFASIPDLRGRPVNVNRTIIFSEDSTGTIFYINGVVYDPNVTNTIVEFGTIEEWHVINNSSELHTFHIHQLNFQVIEINGVAQPFYSFQDTINVPYSNDTFTGSVRLLMPFLADNIPGRFVYHCHILGHEDAGMMATILVQRGPLTTGLSGATTGTNTTTTTSSSSTGELSDSVLMQTNMWLSLISFIVTINANL